MNGAQGMARAAELAERGMRELNEFEQAKADARREWEGKTLKEQVSRMDDLRKLKDNMETALKGINAEYDILRLETIPTKMDEEGIERIVLEGIGRVSLTADLLVSVPADSKGQLFNWFTENGMGDLIQPTVNSSTLKAWVKGRMKDDKPYPAELLNITPITRASITKA